MNEIRLLVSEGLDLNNGTDQDAHAPYQQVAESHNLGPVVVGKLVVAVSHHNTSAVVEEDVPPLRNQDAHPSEDGERRDMVGRHREEMVLCGLVGVHASAVAGNEVVEVDLGCELQHEAGMIQMETLCVHHVGDQHGTRDTKAAALHPDFLLVPAPS